MRVKSANPWWKRGQRLWRRWRGFNQVKTHRVDWVFDEDTRYKRVTFETASEAESVAHALMALSDSGCFSSLIKHDAHEVWVGFVEEDHSPIPLHQALAEFFRALYTATGQPVDGAVDAQVWLQQLKSDLMKLQTQYGVGSDFCEALLASANKKAPKTVLCGFDYVDAVAKNFVIHDGAAIGIDIEAIHTNEGLGLGLAKAEYRGLIDPMEGLLESLLNQSVVDQYPFMRLCFGARYVREKFEQGKKKHIHLDTIQSWFE